MFLVRIVYIKIHNLHIKPTYECYIYCIPAIIISNSKKNKMKKITLSLSNIRFSTLSLLMVVGLFFASSAYAADITYAAVTGDWTDANWTPQAPVAGDNIIIPEGAVVTVSTDAGIKINSLSVSGKLIISVSGILNVEQTTTLNPLVGITGGEIENNGTLSIKLPSATSANNAIAFANGTQSPATNAKFTNVGILNIDLLSSTGHNNASQVIAFNQNTVGTKAQFNVGGTINLSNITAQARFMELLSGSAEIDGTQTFGSSTTPINVRFLHAGASGTVTFMSTANITVNSGFTSSNGVINMSNTGVANYVNNGMLTLHSFTAAGSAINMQPQTSGTGTFTNNGTITADGSWGAGTMYMNGNNALCTATFTNSANGIISFSNTNTSNTNGAAIRASITPTNVINNNGTMILSVASAARAMYFGDNSSTFENNGTVTVNNAITGNDATNACVFNNNASGIFNFNLTSDMSVAVSNNKAITFNNYGTITGIGILASGKFKCLTGTINPGIGTATGIFRIYDTSYTLTGKCIMQINGTTTAGTNYDQIVVGFSPSGALTIDPTATLDVNVGYTPTNLDIVPLFSPFVSCTGTFGTVVAPSKWVTNYTATAANMLYDTSTEIEKNIEINAKIYANNQNIYVNLASDAFAQLQLTDMTGRLIKHIAVKGQNNVINTTGLKGIYIVRLFTSEGNYSQKLSL